MASLRKILHLDSPKRKSVERDEFIGSSLASSGHLSERMLAWSRPNDRERLFPMQFHEEWGHKDCPVMGWYDQQRKSSTRFRSIEHRRNIEGPFFHEFLLLKLTDGAVCRVERTGEGSRADAIRSIGCTAYDFIQWFTKSKYDQFSAKCPSVLIAEVDLCQEFDILDVVAICYSIQNTKACRAYTLQRYNCYFLCLTVLAMLTRRVASWETMVTSDDWDSCVSPLVDKLSNLSPDDSKKYLITRLCALLEPDNPRPGRFIFDTLRVHLSSQAGALASYNQAMNATLWHTAWDSSICGGLITSLRSAAPAILEDGSHCGALFRDAIHTSHEDSGLAIQSDNVFANHYFDVFSKQWELELAKTLEMHNKLLRMREMEQPVSFGYGVLSRLVGPLVGALLALAPASLLAKVGGDYSVTMIFSRVTRADKLKFGSTVSSVLARDVLDKTDTWENLWDQAANLSRKGTVEALLTALLDGLAARGILGPSETSLVISDVLDERTLIVLLASLITSADSSRALYALQEVHQTEICLLVTSQDEPEPSKISITPVDFQETYIRQRIDAHARRVDALQLAAAPLVCEDIENTMTKVWTLLPSGFGGAVMPT
ncbi:hypothetical protein FRC10_004661 [Ceratobasidium sp. 414]|nr:hypothetical protein FRC10_004661 [Ceratobasidium sp. 414]